MKKEYLAEEWAENAKNFVAGKTAKDKTAVGKLEHEDITAVEKRENEGITGTGKQEYSEGWEDITAGSVTSDLFMLLTDYYVAKVAMSGENEISVKFSNGVTLSVAVKDV